jgi:hypothetical protein
MRYVTVSARFRPVSSQLPGRTTKLIQSLLPCLGGKVSDTVLVAVITVIGGIITKLIDRKK